MTEFKTQYNAISEEDFNTIKPLNLFIGEFTS